MAAECFYTPAFICESVPGCARSIDDRVVVVEQSVREVAFLEIEPDALDRIEFGRVRRQRQQDYILGNDELLRAVPAGLVHEHGGDLVLGQSIRELVEKLLHCEGIEFGHYQREGLVRADLGGGKDVGKREAPVGEARWALAPFPPDVTDAPLLADPRLVLKPD
jgi:hypothetical protein